MMKKIILASAALACSLSFTPAWHYHKYTLYPVSDSSDNTIYIGSDYVELRFNNSSHCYVKISAYDNSDGYDGYTSVAEIKFDNDDHTCDYYELPMSDLLAAMQAYQAHFDNSDHGDITQDTPVCLRAFGAGGHESSKSSAHRGKGGVAQTLTTMNDIIQSNSDPDNNGTLRFLLGHKGSSTVVTTTDFTGNDRLYEAEEAGLFFLIAGGGGSSYTYSSGDGGMLSMDQRYCKMVTGGQGQGIIYNGYSVDGGGGGGANYTYSGYGLYCEFVVMAAMASGGTAGYVESKLGEQGKDGIKGAGGKGYDAWSNYSSSFDDEGNGGSANDTVGGGGMGGGASATMISGYYTGSGGAGSYALGVTSGISDNVMSTDWCKDTGYALNDSVHGSVQFIFNLYPFDE